MANIEGGRWEYMIRRLFNIKGAGSVAPVIAPEVMPVAIVQASDPETYGERLEHLCACWDGYTAAAGQFPHIFIVNPVDSGILAVVEAVSAFSTNAGPAQFRMFRYSGVLTIATVQVTEHRDFRYPANPGGATPYVSGIRFGHADFAASQGVGFERRVAPAVDTQVDFGSPPIILPPGQTLGVVLTTVQTALNVNYAWREIPAAPSEITV